MELRVWWNRNGRQSTYAVSTVDEAKAKLKYLANEDLKNRSVIWNAGGLEVYEDGEWSEWYGDDGRDINEIMDDEDELND
ncbi:MAG: hypothetical protein RBS07_15050 [Lentimicrobium sp.]|nr:hypothetical protein [Lentimicrobium sp.]